MQRVRVGILAAILNIITLLLAAIFERIIENPIRIFTVSRLKATGRAPVIHDNYIWLLRIPRSIVLLYNS